MRACLPCCCRAVCPVHFTDPSHTPRVQSYKLSAVSLSPQSLASVAAFYRVTVPVAYAKLEAFFTRHLGVDCVVDTGAGVDLALMEVRLALGRCRCGQPRCTHAPTHPGAAGVGSRVTSGTHRVCEAVSCGGTCGVGGAACVSGTVQRDQRRGAWWHRGGRS